MAEGVGFEPTVRILGQQFSRLPRSTALPSLHYQTRRMNHTSLENADEHLRNNFMVLRLIFKG